MLVPGLDSQSLGQTSQGLLRVIGYTGQPEPGLLVLRVVGCHPPQVVPGLLEPISPDPSADTRDAFNADLHQLLKELDSVSDWPIAVGCASGHCQPNMTLALGLQARLDSASASFRPGAGPDA